MMPSHLLNLPTPLFSRKKQLGNLLPRLHHSPAAGGTAWSTTCPRHCRQINSGAFRCVGFFSPVGHSSFCRCVCCQRSCCNIPKTKEQRWFLPCFRTKKSCCNGRRSFSIHLKWHSDWNSQDSNHKNPG